MAGLTWSRKFLFQDFWAKVANTSLLIQEEGLDIISFWLKKTLFYQIFTF